MAGGMLRSPTFMVGSEKQRGVLDEFQKHEDHISAEYLKKNSPLCFSAQAYQKTHPAKARTGSIDADATLASPMLLGVCDGVSQVEDFGIDPSELPQELLRACEELACSQLVPGSTSPGDLYGGPISLLEQAYEATEANGSTTVLLAALDNMTRIHGKLHPMAAILSIGDCELMILRRIHGPQSELEMIFNTEMQRIDGHVQEPLQLARFDERVDFDIDFDPEIAASVIRDGSAVHCVSACEGDILVLGSDGVFDNLYLNEVKDLCNEYLPPRQAHMPFQSRTSSALQQLARAIVSTAHVKPGLDGKQRTHHSPIGMGGKVDDTGCVVAEVVEWTEAHMREFGRRKRWGGGGMGCCSCHADRDDDVEEYKAMREATAREGVRGNARSMRVEGSHRDTRHDEHSEPASSEESDDPVCC